MHVELVTTPAGRETVEINFGGRIEVLSHQDAIKLADWILDLCNPKPIDPVDTHLHHWKVFPDNNSLIAVCEICGTRANTTELTK